MLVTFSCEVYPNTTYFGDIAKTLLKMMGLSGKVPGAILAGDVPKALERLQNAIDKLDDDTPKPSSDQESSKQDDWKEKPVTLKNRALPLIELLKAAAKENCNVMWDHN